MTFRTTLAALAALAFVPAAASAQTRFEVGGGYDFEAEAPFVGAGARIPLTSLPITLAPHGDFYFIDNGTYIQGNLDGLYSFPGVRFSPYVGAGLGLGYIKPDNFDSDTEVGLNLLAGATFSGARLNPYVQVRANVGGPETLGLSAGVIF